MEPGEAPPPFMAPAENDVKYDTNNNEEEEGEQFDFESGDEAPEADRQALACEGGGTAPGLSSSSLEGGDKECGTGALAGVEPAELTVPVKVNPYSIIDITPLQEDALPPPEPPTEEDGVAGPVPSGYLVPAPCGYAVPSSLPALLPAYSSPVIIRMESVDEEAEAPEVAEDHQLNSPSAADPPHSGDQSSREGNALARWAADPANTAWMDNPEEAIYDDVPRENSDSEPDEMVYDDVENGEQGGNSSVEYGWSSSEFESYEEQSDSECRNGVPRSFLRGSHKKQVVRRCILGSIVESEKNYVDALRRILEQYEKPLSELEPRVLSERKLKAVFYRVKEIAQCHSLFQMALASRVAEWDTVETIGDVFVASFSKSMVLDAYSEYVNNFSTAVAVLKKTCATKPAFLEFLKQSREAGPDRVTLHSLMMRPIQRFPQFILLLQDMLKNTSRGHPDRLPLQMALTELETLAEKLNERKRDADRRCEIRHIAKAVNERYLNKLLSSGSRYLLRSDDMIETVYNDRGEVAKTKGRRLFLLNDVLVCATVSSRPSQESHSGAGQRYLLKWSVPLGHVEVIEYGSGPSVGEHSRHPTAHAPESLAVSANVKPHKAYLGPGQLYQDLQNLLHDLNVVGQIAQLIGSLRGNYQNLNQSVAHDWTSGLQRLILKKEDEIRAADRCRIQLQLPGKQDKSGRPTFFTAVFNTFTPAIKEAWTSHLQMAKLALEEDNHLGWFCVDDDGNQTKKDTHPLLVGHMPVMVARQPEFKIECAAYNPEPCLSSEGHPGALSSAVRGFLWIGSCSSQMGQIAIVSFQNSNPKVIECFNVESRILCMVHIPAQEQRWEPCVASDATATRAPDVPTICLGTEEGSISIYKSSQGSKKVRLQHFFAPERSAVLSLACSLHGLHAGLVNGSVASYTRATDGSWNEEPHKVIKLGVLPVRSLLVAEDALWAACGGQVSTISTETHTAEGQLEAHQEEGMVISHMAVAGVGLWLAFTTGSTLRLFHTETLKHLQDVNIAAPVHSMLPGHQRLSVTSLLVCHGLLMVGTSLGVVVALPVPRLQGIPKVTGRGMVSYHAHNGPVKFIVLATTPAKDQDKPRDSPPPGPELPVEERKDMPSGDGSTLAPSQGDTNTAVWLGAWPGPGPQKSGLPPLGSPSLSLGSSSLEHGSEDSSICDLLRDPAAPTRSRARPARRAKASSALVVCGGQGHRHVHRKARPPPEELVSSVMVWQIPLLSA
ncbi:rho guanine nucleotide exchange factor 10 isoform X10 [Octodon degus]|uniref:Rho guanine nucleotide exchange factor 10 n=1 Tax=Octodon degus TaxID=10160 RepID=A0A6P6DFL6_OCTDE|nr:rho guanine nucleotide exchange factor 10 isoform X10 [Octodon degus]